MVKYFESLYNKSSENNTGIIETHGPSENTNIEIIILITEVQITNAIAKLKNRKSPGNDQISNELIQYSGDSLVQELARLYGKTITLRKVPTEWKKSITIPLFKKCDKNDSVNFRGITLLSSAMKLSTNIINADSVQLCS